MNQNQPTKQGNSLKKSFEGQNRLSLNAGAVRKFGNSGAPQYLGGSQLKRRQYSTLAKEIYVTTTSGESTVGSGLSKISTKEQTLAAMLKHAQLLATTPSTKYVRRDILKRLAAPKLEEDFPEALLTMLEEVTQEFVDVTHKVGVSCIIKLPEGHITLKPYRLPGKTDFHATRLQIIKLLETRLFITFPLVRRILNYCVQDLPQCLIDFTKYRTQAYDVQDLHEMFNEEIAKAKSSIHLWYSNVGYSVRNDDAPISPTLEINYFSCGTGLISVYLSEALRTTIEHLIHVTEHKEQIPHLKMSLHFNKTIILEPNLSTISNLYVQLVEKIASIANHLPSLEASRCQGYNDKLIPIFIPPERQNFYKKCIGSNIVKLFAPVNEYIKLLNEEFSGAFTPQENASSSRSETFDHVAQADSSLLSSNASNKTNDSKTVEMEKDKYITFLENDITFEEGYLKVNFYKSYIDKLSVMVDTEYYLVGQLEQSVCRESIRRTLRDIVEKISYKLTQQHIWESEDICEQFQALSFRALAVPQASDELNEMVTFMSWATTEHLPTLEERVRSSLSTLTRLMEMTILSDDHIALNSLAVKWIDDMKPIIEQNSAMIETCKFDFEERLQRNVEHLHACVKEFFPRLELLDEMDDADNSREYLNSLARLLVEIQTFDDQLESINKEETTFKFPLTTIAELTELKQHLFPFHRLVRICFYWKRNYAAWLTGPLKFLDFAVAEVQIDNYYKELVKNEKTFRAKIRQSVTENHRLKFKGLVDDPDPSNHPSPVKLCTKTINEINHFRPSLNMMRIMCNDALLQRHWDEMSEIAGFDMTPNSGTTLSKLMKLKLENNIDKYEIISSGAIKERQLLENLQKMQTEWDGVYFKTTVYKDTGINILTQLDDIQAVLDDHLIKTLTMRGSVFVKPFESQVKQWYEKIIRMTATLEEWNKVQSQWLHLLPIYSSKGITNEIPEEVVLFKYVDKIHLNYMDLINKEQKAITLLGSTELLDELINCTHLLEKVSEGAATYLERKRLLFPRFFFLSNDDMLEIISETKNPLRIQKYLRKCFAGIGKLEFDDQMQIKSMCSEEKEKIDFLSTIDTTAAQGSIDGWLAQVETKMYARIRDMIIKSQRDYVNKERRLWAQSWPQQIVIVVSQIFWASSIHVALNSTASDTFSQFFKSLKDDLELIVTLIRTTNLSNLKRTTIKALIVTLINAKGVTQELDKARSATDFKWAAQLRYYWMEECTIKLINATIKYAYEYLGNSDRLVVTPLTERCYRTIVGVYHLHLNGAPEGPAGAGKTETVKDLAKALAVYCVIFNCSDGLDHRSMEKFLKGLACSGAWACFDEFDRIEVNVLSVVAQQILCISLAKRAKATTFIFDGTELTLKPTCYICVTMNPNYAGRSKLPSNLKALFRPVAMAVPDFKMISEVSLYSYGFKNAKALATKIVTVFQLCWEQLSSQNFYDYGIRAVKSVLYICDTNKCKFSDQNEDYCVLQAIMTVNLPKLFNHDSDLFKHIISDIFPKPATLTANHKDLINAIERSCAERNLQGNGYLTTKILQTSEMMVVRHGFMLIGEPFAGKTSVLQVLSDALTMCNHQESGTIKYQCINPKAVTIGQLYGQFDPISHEWFDGIAANCFRRFSTDSASERRWVIFDGPVDTVWIENMNTVLDDTKKLCLMSGEVIFVTGLMSIIFEVIDLAHASPSTVSRCGVIYMEPGMLGWKHHVQSWLTTCSKDWCESNEQLILIMFDWLVPPSLSFISQHCCQLCHSIEINLVKSMMQIVSMVLTDACNESSKKEEDFKNMQSWIQATFIYAAVWGLGGILDIPSRDKFDDFFRTLLKGQNVNHPYPSTLEKLDVAVPLEGLLFDYAYVYKGKGAWKYWLEIAKVMKVDEATNIQQILIPTVDTVKYMHILEMHIRNKIPVLLIGPTGTGKSFYLQDLLMNRLNQDLYEPAFVSFTATITANQTQEFILSKLNKRKRGHYGPPAGKMCVIFVDDLNMPIKEIYGAQPPIELLRQYFDHKSWYDFKDNSILYLHEVLLTAAMGPAGGSKQDIYSRFLRHFSIFSINEFSEESTSKIYTNILVLGFKNNGFPGDVVSHVQQIVAATLNVYGQSLQNLRPVPGKSHYVFNLRDISRIIFGCAMLKKESADNKTMFAKIWIHEVLRVIYDKLVDTKDKTWLFNQIENCVSEHFKESFETVLENFATDEGGICEETLQKLMFSTYLDMESGEEDKKYEEVANIEALQDLAAKFMETYNSTHKIKLNIVLFKNALQHLSRICRILTMPCGNALLVGMNGSGRQSLTKLASCIAGHSFFQPEITNKYSKDDWRSDIKKVVREAGGQGKQTVFLFTDSQIKEEAFLEDIDSLLNSGEVANIFKIDEKQEILEMTRLIAQGGNRNLDISALSIFSFFVKRTREKLHIVICFSPVGTNFKTRLRLYPSLVNCCTIDWYESWPEEALEKVAEKYLKNTNLPEEIKICVTTAYKYIHTSAQSISDSFFAETAHKTYITSASYLELVENYRDLINSHKVELMANKSRYVAGLQKLEFAAAQTAELQKSLEAYQPQLKEMSERAVEMKKEIEKETIQVEHASALVRKDEEIANAQAAEAQNLKAECEADLAEAIPILEDAIAALNTLKPTDITLVKSMKNPPDAIKLVMAAVCVIKDVKPDRLPDPSTGRKILDYWGPSKRILGDIAFLQSLKDFDKDHIKPEIMVKIRKEYIPHKDFKPHTVAKASSAAEGLCKWIIAMDMYDKVAKEVAPKKEKLEKAEHEYAATMAVLLEKKEEVTRLEKKLADLNIFLDEATQKQRDLQERVDMCENKLKRARQLLGGLGGEKLRWITAADGLQDRYDCLAGDILISCGLIAYLTSFSYQWRLQATNDWLKYIKNLNMPVDNNYNFIATMGSDTKIQKWNMFELPQDAFFIENAIIQDHSKRWSLLVDPQLQANVWIRKMEKENGIRTTKLSTNEWFEVLEQCIESGFPLLIENVCENFEFSLNPLLRKATFREAGIDFITLCGKTITYHPNFKLYLTSTMRNATYSPDVFNKVNIINFILTTTGLEEQLLNILIAKEKPEMQRERNKLITEIASNKEALNDVQNMILKTLSEATGDILENENAIRVLDQSKALAVNIEKKQLATKDTEDAIARLQMDYKPVATLAAGLYHCISDLSNIDPMYQFSLGWFVKLYINSIETSKNSRFLEKKLQFLKENIAYNLYEFVCRSLFDKDKLLFSFLLCTKSMLHQLTIEKKELAYFYCSTSKQVSPANPAATWLSNKSWAEIWDLEQIVPFQDFRESFIKDIEEWKTFCSLSEPQNNSMPFPWEDKLTPFQKLLVIKILRPDKIKATVSRFVENEMGAKFITPPPFDISTSFEQSSCICPLIFILSERTNAVATISKFARIKGYKEKFRCISLGQGQGSAAEILIKQGQNEGLWVCLQNCHLAEPWMVELEKISENMSISNTNVHFRLWLTSCSSDKFPVSVLQNSVKMTDDSPTGLRNELLRLYLTEPICNQEFCTECPGNELMFTRMLYGVAFFHAVIRERRSFGPLGWNIAYEFNELDFNISVLQLQMFINEFADNPYEGVCYLTGECNYGGHITDEWDRRLMINILKDYLNTNLVCNMNYSFSPPDQRYCIPRKAEYEEYLRYIRNFPQNHSPEVLGLHSNLKITRDLQESMILLNSITMFQRKKDFNSEEDAHLDTFITDILSSLPNNFEVKSVEEKYPINYNNSMNTVLVQELERFNKLLTMIRNSLQTLKEATEGLIIMIPKLECLKRALALNRIPDQWTKVSYPSVKSLSNYISDLIQRIEFFHKWCLDGQPNTFWLPGFFFIQAFLVGTKQDYSRKHAIPIYQLTFDFEILKVTCATTCAQNGLYLSGLFIEGARWDIRTGALSELLPGILNDFMPLIWLQIVTFDKYQESGRYICPLYNTSARQGVLSTTGHSSNYVLSLPLNTKVDPSHWIKRSVAMLCQPD